MDVRVSLSGWSPADRLCRSAIARPVAFACVEIDTRQEAA
jgi:hypothetical protein